MQIMSKEKAAEYRAKYAKDTAKWGGETFQHFATSEEWERHLEQVTEAQEKHHAPF